VAFGVATFITQIAPDWFKPWGSPSSSWSRFLQSSSACGGFSSSRRSSAGMCSGSSLPRWGGFRSSGLLQRPIHRDRPIHGRFILAIMALPFITAMMRDMFEIVPGRASYRLCAPELLATARVHRPRRCESPGASMARRNRQRPPAPRNASAPH
jgi:hypothetical protein